MTYQLQMILDDRGTERKNMNTLYIVRHGQSVHNEAGDSEPYPVPTYRYGLTRTGVEQSKEAGVLLREMLGEEGVSFIVSDYERTKQTFEQISQAFVGHLDMEVHVEPILRERERRGFNTPMAGEQMSLFYRDDIDGGQGETGAELYDRMYAFWTGLKLRAALGELKENVVLVGHGRSTMALLAVIYECGAAGYDATAKAMKNAQIVKLSKAVDGKFESEDEYVIPFREAALCLKERLGGTRQIVKKPQGELLAQSWNELGLRVS